ncbi:hypothetical protein BJ138DRAFT_28813 [Hygrophoropsis aurantiaca]|uniref:Uncharacterized protein n=1 Tax=Hygrophoropsis aurantiaca TaxID=72124 RepID=A0ACB8AE60_9AGAM|nr:hypothetical protein BJ138DRAFT_28813 [Hygrophoropsis aurantiaca]
MTLIHRFNSNEEHAQFLSTQHHLRMSIASLILISDLIYFMFAAQGNAVWYNGLCPSLKEAQQVLRRMRTDPDLTQDIIFREYGPIFVFACLVISAAIVLRTGVISSMAEMSLSKVVLVGSCFALVVFFAMALVRTAIWSIASGIGMFVDMNLEEDKDRSFQLTETGVLLGGFF